MKPSRSIAFALMVAALAAAPSGAQAQAASAPTPAATVQALCDALISAMKQGPALGFAGRRQLLEPEIRRAIDLPLMTRLVLGPPWRTLTPDLQRQLVDAFSDYSISTYANRFSGFSGEPEPVRLDYLMRSSGGSWKIIDVYLSGTISELAARRSEFSAVLRQGGAAALVETLRKKAAELSG